MARTLFGLFGIGMALFPDRFLETYERLALENPEEADAREWVSPMVRGEGLLAVALSLLGGRGLAAYAGATGIVGLLAALFPERYARAGFAIAYEDAEELEFREGFLTAVRVLGAFAVLLAIRIRRRR